MQEPVGSPLLQQNSECSASEKVDMKTSDVGWVDPGLIPKSTDLSSSLVEQNKDGISCKSPLAAAEPNYSLTGENCEDANEV